MKLKLHPVADYEFERFRLYLSKPIEDSKSRLEQLFQLWMQDRAEQKLCSCFVKHLEVEPPKSTKRIDVICGWFCEKCLVLLQERIEREIPEVTRIEIGNKLTDAKAPSLDYLIIEPKRVTFENGKQVDVARFAIRRSVVTVGEFEQFVKATGLVTRAEQESDETFRLNVNMHFVKPTDRHNCSAYCVTYHEAEAFAQWAGARLPTEAEWLAAALIDDRVMKLQEYERFMFGGTPQSRPRAPLGFSGQEWVTGETVQEDYVQLSNWYEMNPMAFGWVKVVEGEKLAVARSGPQIVRCEGWQNATQHRMVAPARCHDIMITFRLAKNLE